MTMTTAPSGGRVETRDISTQALEQLDALYGLAMRLTGRTAEAEALVYQTYVRAFAAADRCGSDPSVKVWMFRHLRVTWRDGGYRAACQPVAPACCATTEPRIRVQHHQGSPLSTPAAAEDAASIRAAVETLPVALLETVWLRDMLGFSYAEIVDTLDVPCSTVKVQLSRGRWLIAERLGVAQMHSRPEAC